MSALSYTGSTAPSMLVCVRALVRKVDRAGVANTTSTATWSCMVLGATVLGAAGLGFMRLPPADAQGPCMVKTGIA